MGGANGARIALVTPDRGCLALHGRGRGAPSSGHGHCREEERQKGQLPAGQGGRGSRASPRGEQPAPGCPAAENPPRRGATACGVLPGFRASEVIVKRELAGRSSCRESGPTGVSLGSCFQTRDPGRGWGLLSDTGTLAVCRELRSARAI